MANWNKTIRGLGRLSGQVKTNSVRGYNSFMANSFVKKSLRNDWVKLGGVAGAGLVGGAMLLDSSSQHGWGANLFSAAAGTGGGFYGFTRGMKMGGPMGGAFGAIGGAVAGWGASRGLINHPVLTGLAGAALLGGRAAWNDPGIRRNLKYGFRRGVKNRPWF